MSWGGCVWSAHKYTYNVHWGYIEKVFFYKRVDQQCIIGHEYFWSFIWIFQEILPFHKIFYKSETKFGFWKNEKIYQKLRQVSDVISLSFWPHYIVGNPLAQNHKWLLFNKKSNITFSMPELYHICLVKNLGKLS